MSVVTFEGIVEEGQIRLQSNIRLPENTKVLVVVPDIKVDTLAKIVSPRLAHYEEAQDFELEMAEERGDAHL